MNKIHLFLFCCFLSLFLSCSSEELDGHWHLRWTEDDRKGGTIDFVNDTLATINLIAHIQSPLSIQRNKKLLSVLLPEISDIQYTYKITGSLLFLEQNGKKVLVGRRPKTENCSPEFHFFENELVDITLPVIPTSSLNPKQLRKSLNSYIYMGKPKKRFVSTHGDSTCLQLNYEFSSLEHLKLFLQKEELKVQEQLHPLIKIMLHVDKNTKMGKVVEFIKAKQNINAKRLFIVGKTSQDSRKEFNRTYLPAEKIKNFDPEETLEHWTTKNLH